jgi:hypothetical protein
MPSTHRNMTHKDFPHIPSPFSGFVQLEIKDWARQNKNKKDTSQKLIQGDSLFGKSSLGLNFSLSCNQV